MASLNQPTTSGPVQKTVNLGQELLLGGTVANSLYTFLADYLSTLPRYVDDVERDFGTDLYERMLRDAGVAAAMQGIKSGVLAHGVRITGRVPKPPAFRADAAADAEYAQSEAIRVECEDMLDNLQQSINAILWDMLDSLAYGHRLAEKTYELRGAKLWLTTLRVKARTRYYLVGNRYNDLLGAVSADTGSGATSVVSEESLIPREKFMYLAPFIAAGDPRGVSLLRPAYNPWYLKQQAWPHYLKFLAQFATPSVAGILPPDAGDIPIVDSAGNAVLGTDGYPSYQSAAAALLAKLQAWANGTAIALQNGTELQLIQSQSDGSAYIKAIDLFDRQMVMGIIGAARALMESQHGSKADSESAMDVLDALTGHVQREVENAVFRDVLYPTVRYNYGDAIARQFAPVLVLSAVADEDLAGYGQVVAQLCSAGYLHSSQYAGVDAMLNLPERDIEAMAADEEEERLAARERAMNLGKALNPLDGDEEDGQV